MQSGSEGRTEASEKNNLFADTQWTKVIEAKDNSTDALNSLCTLYRSPLLAWLRCRGEKNENAEDSVQGFFEQLLRRDFLKDVGREKGRFRTFLLTAFQNFLRDQYRRSSADKRGGNQNLASLD